MLGLISCEPAHSCVIKLPGKVGNVIPIKISVRSFQTFHQLSPLFAIPHECLRHLHKTSGEGEMINPIFRARLHVGSHPS